MKPNRQQIQQIIKHINYENDPIEAQSLIALAYLTKLKTNKLLNLKGKQIIKIQKKVVILAWGKNIEINTTDPLTPIIEKHVERILPNDYIFEYLRSERTVIKNNKPYTIYSDKYYYWIKKWFGTNCMNVTPKDLM